MSAKGHYLVIVRQTRSGTEREHFPLLSVDESEEEALARYVASHPDMIDRVRNRAKAEADIRAGIHHTKLARPSSYWDAKRAAGWKPRTRARRTRLPGSK